MTLLYCTDCNKVIDEEDLDYETETYEFWGAPYSERYPVCPYCKSDALTDELPPECSCCGEYCTGRHISTEDGEYYCINCYTIIEK